MHFISGKVSKSKLKYVLSETEVLMYACMYMKSSKNNVLDAYIFFVKHFKVM